MPSSGGVQPRHDLDARGVAADVIAKADRPIAGVPGAGGRSLLVWTSRVHGRQLAAYRVMDGGRAVSQGLLRITARARCGWPRTPGTRTSTRRHGGPEWSGAQGSPTCLSSADARSRSTVACPGSLDVQPGRAQPAESPRSTARCDRTGRSAGARSPSAWSRRSCHRAAVRPWTGRCMWRRRSLTHRTIRNRSRCGARPARRPPAAGPD
jgi:hypothetical protein